MERKGFIGGSDCVKIMQGDWLDLWLVKTGRAEAEDLSDNIAVQLGIFTEKFNISWFERQHSCKLDWRQETFREEIGGVPLAGTVDAYWMEENAIVECKHTHAMNNMEHVIEYYMPQIQAYARLGKTAGVYVSALFGNNKWESAYVARNDDYFNSMWALVSDFWGYVTSDREPIGVSVPSISIDKIEVDKMVRRDASKDNAFVAAAHDYIENESAAKAFALAKDDLKNMVGDNEREVYCDLLTVKRAKNGSLRITTRRV
jgi:predicted phage-related endonuclease